MVASDEDGNHPYDLTEQSFHNTELCIESRFLYNPLELESPIHLRRYDSNEGMFLDDL